MKKTIRILLLMLVITISIFAGTKDFLFKDNNSIAINELNYEKLWDESGDVEAFYPTFRSILNETESMTVDDKDYWNSIYLSLHEDQISRLMKILEEERKRLKKLDEDYQKEKIDLIQTSITEWMTSSNNVDIENFIQLNKLSVDKENILEYIKIDIDKANDLIKKGFVEEGYENLRKYLKEPWIYYILGIYEPFYEQLLNALYANKQYIEVIELVKIVKNYDANNPKILGFAGHSALALNDYNEAYIFYKDAIALGNSWYYGFHSDFNLFIEKKWKGEDNYVFVEGGTFTLGKDTNGNGFRDNPIRKVTLGSFYISKYEVTQREYKELMGYNPSKFFGDNNPVEQVTWYDAVMYANKLSEKKGLKPYYSINGIIKDGNKIIKANVDVIGGKGYRLPTEDEWETAAKGGKKSKNYKYSGSNNIDEVAWHTSNSNNKSQAVAQKKSNELGIWIYVNILDTIFFVFYEYFFSNSIGLKYPNLL